MTAASLATPSSQSQAGQPKWQQVLTDVENRLRHGEYQPGDPFPTLGQLAQQYGVSDITVRRVFRELKSKGQIVTNGRLGTFVASSKKRQPLFICGPQTQGQPASASGQDVEFYNRFYAYYHQQHLDKVFELRTLSTDFCMQNPQFVADATLFVMMESLLTVRDNSAVVDPQKLAFFQDHGRSIVFRSLLGPIPGLRQVGIDLRDGVKQTTRHLIKQGHKHLAILTGSLSNLWFKPRFEGFLDELAQHGLPCDPAYIHVTKGLDPAQDYAAMDKLMALSPRPTAVVCVNDTRALHVLEYCRNKGLRVPQDLAVTGLDNSLEGLMVSPSLTTLDHRLDEMVRSMFELARKGSSQDDPSQWNHVVKPLIILRESSVVSPAPKRKKK
jgi:DNA-binding transcriptional regulator YhcF (GntR family)